MDKKLQDITTSVLSGNTHNSAGKSSDTEGENYLPLPSYFLSRAKEQANIKCEIIILDQIVLIFFSFKLKKPESLKAMVPSTKERTVVPVSKSKYNARNQGKWKRKWGYKKKKKRDRFQYKDKLVRFDYKTKEVMFDDKLLKLTEREVIALGKSRVEEKTGFEFGPQYDFCNIVPKNRWNEIIRTELNMALNSRRKTLRPYNGKVIISENGQEGEENNNKE